MIQLNPATGKRSDKRLEGFANPDDLHSGLEVIRSLARHNGDDKTDPESRSIDHSWQALDAVATRSSGLFRRAASHVEEMLLDDHVERLAAAEAGRGH